MFREPNRRRIYLMRHAEAAYVTPDGTVTDDPRSVGLTAQGQVQARKQSAVLASVAFDRAICSGLNRTRETARLILAQREHPELETLPQLEEIRGGGRDHPVENVAAWLDHVANPWAGADHPVENVAAWLDHVANPWAGADHPEATFLGGERFVDFAERVVPAFEAILADHTWRSLLLVLHGAVNRMLFNHMMNLTWQARMSIEQDNCCINIIDVDSADDGTTERFLVRAVNLTAYDLNKSSIHLTNMEQTARRIAELHAGNPPGGRV